MSKHILISCGHGLYTNGKRCLKSIDKSQTREWFLNDRVANYLEEYLKSYDTQVTRLDDRTGKTDVSLSSRVKKANSIDATALICIHHNAGINGGTGGGVTVMRHPNSSKVSPTDLQEFYYAIVSQNKLIGNRATPYYSKQLYELSHTVAPAYYLENGFMDSTTDTPIILTDSHAKSTAKGILNFLVNKYKIELLKTTDDTPTNVEHSLKLKIGAFKDLKNALSFIESKLKPSSEFSIHYDGTYYRVYEI